MSEPQAPANPTDALVDALEPDEAAVATGHFSLDPEAARTKLREHQLDDPNAYVLLLVEAAAAANAGTGGIHFELGTTTTAEFGGLPLGAESLDDLLGAVFAPLSERPSPERRRAQALRLLGLAANAALAAGATEVEVQSVDESGQTHCVTLAPEGPARLEQRGPGQAGACRFRFVGSLLDRRRPEHERTLLFARCRYSSFSVFVGQTPFNRGHAAALPEGVRARSVTLPGHGVVGVAAHANTNARAKAIILTRGVLAELVPLEHCQPGFVAIIEVDLRKDLSQRHLVRDAAYERAIRAIRQAHDALPQSHARPGTAAAKREDEKLPRHELALVLALVLLPIPLGLALISLRDHDPAAKRLELLEQACDAGDDSSCTQLAEQLDDRSRARELLEHSCARGHAPACEARELAPDH